MSPNEIDSAAEDESIEAIVRLFLNTDDSDSSEVSGESINGNPDLEAN